MRSSKFFACRVLHQVSDVTYQAAEVKCRVLHYDTRGFDARPDQYFIQQNRASAPTADLIFSCPSAGSPIGPGRPERGSKSQNRSGCAQFMWLMLVRKTVWPSPLSGPVPLPYPFRRSLRTSS
jgi:hypothetical protein